MRYIFKEFEFDDSNLVLSKNGQSLDLRHNEVCLLALLIKHSNKVLSKEDILSEVWKDKVVSEQAVFQNISHLRNILGNDAIKTFPKRGYQWQLSLEQALNKTHSEQPEPEIPTTANINTSGSNSLRKPHGLYITLLISFICILSVIFWNLQINKNQPAPIASIAYGSIYNPNNKEHIVFEDTEKLTFTALTDFDSNKFKNSIQLEYPLIAAEHPYVLMSDLSLLKQDLRLRFSLKGPVATWNGEITGNSVAAILKQLHHHLSHKFIYDLISNPQPPEVKQAKLSIAHQHSPDDAIILGQLINAFIDIRQLDNGNVMAEKLATQAVKANKIQHLGDAYLYQADILIYQKRLALSAEKIGLALEQFERNNDLARQSDAWMLHAKLAHEYGDYLTIKSSLLQSAHLSQQANDIQREADALTHLSMLAHKYSEEEDQYFYLLKAKKRMKAHKLPLYHFAVIPFHEAAFTGSPSGKEPYLLKVLELTEATPDHWMAQTSRLQLMEHYLEQGRLSAANKLIANLSSDNARNSYLKSLLFKAQNKLGELIVYAKRTFEQAQMAGNKHLSLDAALLLLESKDASVSSDFYSQYIQNSATTHWREKRKDKLNQLAL
ncbi:winged helix-turn-helix domain-containing protein [Paraglaciecola sp.]|uniref:winged helix-turn-helix domain-containing protein n=1 Tax=Paraglaciecola sp. TaxID=1920173 RepID=UPI003EFA1615